MKVIYFHITLNAEDLAGKSWEKVIGGIVKDFKKEKLPSLNKDQVPKGLTASLILTYSNGGKSTTEP